MEDGRRMITLRHQERRDIARRRIAEGAAALFLDLDHHRTWKEIAEELGISISALKDLTKSEIFEEVYNQLYTEITHDPRYKAVQAGLGDMLTVATDKLRKLLTSDRTPPTVALNAIKTVYEYAGVKPPNEQISERQALAAFLANHNLRPGTPLEIPSDYEAAMSEYGVSIVEGEFQEVDTESREEAE